MVEVSFPELLLTMLLSGACSFYCVAGAQKVSDQSALMVLAMGSFFSAIVCGSALFRLAQALLNA